MARRTIRKGGRIGKGYNYVFETGEVTFSNDPNIPVGSNVYRDNVRRDQRKPEVRKKDKVLINPTDDDQNRVRKIIGDLIGVEGPDDLMSKIIQSLKNSVTPIPVPGKFYTFIYTAQTPNIVYDQHPLIACTEIYNSDSGIGFIGFNYHWGMMRRYRLDRADTLFYEVDAGEIADLREIPYAKFLNT